MKNLYERWNNANNLTEQEINQLRKDLLNAHLVSEEEINTKWECIQK